MTMMFSNSAAAFLKPLKKPLSAALFVAAAFVTTAHANPPPGPINVPPDERAFFRSLMVPKPVTADLETRLADYFLAQTVDEALRGIGESENMLGIHCCHIVDCDYVDAVENPDGSYEVDLGDKFPKSSSRIVHVSPNKLTKESDRNRFHPAHAVLCANKHSDDLDINRDFPNATGPIFCFRPVTVHVQNEWIPLWEQRQYSTLLQANPVVR